MFSPALIQTLSPRKRKERSQQGFTMMEVILSLFIFTLMALIVTAAIPISARSIRYGNDYVQAATLAMHKVNQVQEAGYANMNRSLNGTYLVVDTNGSLPNSNTNGTASGTASFTLRDNLSSYFVGGVSDPAGILSIAPYAPSMSVVGGVTSYSVIEVTIEVRWRDVRGKQQNYFTKTLVSKNPIL
jgi:prepilin-type N-terminal cleavage/methylation domain-containing protein